MAEALPLSASKMTMLKSGFRLLKIFFSFFEKLEFEGFAAEKIVVILKQTVSSLFLDMVFRFISTALIMPFTIFFYEVIANFSIPRSIDCSFRARDW